MAAAKPRIYKTDSGAVVHGVLGEFPTPASVYHAAEIFRDAGYRDWDVYAPFPIHGIDEAMGIRRTRLPLLVATVGLSGAALGFLFQTFVGLVYPITKQGKPYAAWEALVPVTFEIGVLFTAFATLLGMLAFNGLPRWHHPLLKKERFLRVGDDRYMIAVESQDPKFDPVGVRALMEKHGAVAVELVEE